MTKLRGAAAVLMVVLLGLGISATPANAHTTQPPAEANCFSWWTEHGGPFSNSVTACFEANGDKLWVEDDNPDGHSVKAFFQTAGGFVGECRNAHGATSWHACGFSWIDEQDDIRFWICLTEGSSQTPVHCTTDLDQRFTQPKSCWLRADSGFGTPGGCNVPRGGNLTAARVGDKP